MPKNTLNFGKRRIWNFEITADSGALTPLVSPPPPGQVSLLLLSFFASQQEPFCDVPPGSRDRNLQPPWYLWRLCRGLRGLRSGLPEVAGAGLRPMRECGRWASSGARSLLHALLTVSPSLENPPPCRLVGVTSFHPHLSTNAGLVHWLRAASSTVLGQ